MPSKTTGRAIIALMLGMLSSCAVANPYDAASGVSKFDGAYNFFFKYPSPSGQASRTLSRYLMINNGRVSSSDGTATGTVDSFGSIRFQTPCPINSSSAVWTGTMNASAQSGSNFGQGSYTCTIAIGGGSLDTWQVTQTP